MTSAGEGVVLASSSRLWIDDVASDSADVDPIYEVPQLDLMVANVSRAVFDLVVDAGDLLVDDADLLMPLWAYRSAAAYLLFISVIGIIMNVVVVIVIVNDPQVTLYK